jgi:ribosomal-protein-alanine N-acetyltransferase
MTAPQEIKTARLLLRPLETGDLPEMAHLAGAREIAATTVRIPHPNTPADAENFLALATEEFREGSSCVFAICVAPGRQLCGAIGLQIAPAHRHAELGYWIGVPYWGRGYATEAARAVVAFGFETLGLHRIYAHHFAGNDPSGRVLLKIGMKYEGKFREHVRKWDRFIDVENYGVLESEFRSEE